MSNSTIAGFIPFLRLHKILYTLAEKGQAQIVIATGTGKSTGKVLSQSAYPSPWILEAFETAQLG
ncbi:hypothetical protein [Streptococcus danieliae]|uniref:hypothetical protein n=1 Tax=Streptococcus danieliae TaxID=747656 RepID=UPI003CF36639